MELSRKEKDILTIIDGTPVKKLMKRVRKFIKSPEKEIDAITKRLIDNGFIEIIAVPSGKKEMKLYYHTKKVRSEMLNDTIRYKLEKK